MAQDPTVNGTAPDGAGGEGEERWGGVASWSIRRPVGTLMLTAVILVLGAMFISRLPLDLLPRIVAAAPPHDPLVAPRKNPTAPRGGQPAAR